VNRGDDVITTFLSGVVFLSIVIVVVVSILSFLTQ